MLLVACYRSGKDGHRRNFVWDPDPSTFLEWGIYRSPLSQATKSKILPSHIANFPSGFALNHNFKQVCRSSLLSGWNVHWPRRMLPLGESRWVCRRDKQTDRRTYVRPLDCAFHYGRSQRNQRCVEAFFSFNFNCVYNTDWIAVNFARDSAVRVAFSIQRIYASLQLSSNFSLSKAPMAS